MIRRELVLYTCASACAFMIDMGVLLLLTQVFAVHYLLAAGTAFALAVSVAYLLCVKFVFRYRRLQRGESEFGIFFGVGLVGFAVNTGMMALGVEMLGLPLLIAKLGATGVTVFLNFALRKLLLFTRFDRARAATLYVPGDGH